MEKYDNLEKLRKLYNHREEEVDFDKNNWITIIVLVLALLYFGFGILKATCPFLW